MCFMIIRGEKKAKHSETIWALLSFFCTAQICWLGHKVVDSCVFSSSSLVSRRSQGKENQFGSIMLPINWSWLIIMFYTCVCVCVCVSAIGEQHLGEERGTIRLLHDSLRPNVATWIKTGLVNYTLFSLMVLKIGRADVHAAAVLPAGLFVRGQVRQTNHEVCTFSLQHAACVILERRFSLTAREICTFL